MKEPWEIIESLLRHYAPQALDCSVWTLSGNSQTDSILREAREIVDHHKRVKVTETFRDVGGDICTVNVLSYIDDR